MQKRWFIINTNDGSMYGCDDGFDSLDDAKNWCHDNPDDLDDEGYVLAQVQYEIKKSGIEFKKLC